MLIALDHLQCVLPCRASNPENIDSEQDGIWACFGGGPRGHGREPGHFWEKGELRGYEGAALMAGKERDMGYNPARNRTTSSCCRLDFQTLPYSLQDQKFTLLFSVKLNEVVPIAVSGQKVGLEEKNQVVWNAPQICDCCLRWCQVLPLN